MTMLRRIEEASLNAWPALEQMLFDGWVIRMANGYTKRANSVTPLYPSNYSLERNVAYCEALYRRRGQPPIFRLTSLLAAKPLDDLLAKRGYALVSPSLVLRLDLADRDGTVHADGEMLAVDLAEWLPLFCNLRGVSLSAHATHGEMIARIPGEALLAVWRVEGQIVGCALGVLEQNCFGLYDLIVAPERRRKGHGCQLVDSMLDWATARGATCAYLQVEQGNLPAEGLYASLGYEFAYRYWYRVGDRDVEKQPEARMGLFRVR